MASKRPNGQTAKRSNGQTAKQSISQTAALCSVLSVMPRFRQVRICFLSRGRRARSTTGQVSASGNIRPSTFLVRDRYNLLYRDCTVCDCANVRDHSAARAQCIEWPSLAS